MSRVERVETKESKVETVHATQTKRRQEFASGR